MPTRRSFIAYLGAASGSVMLLGHGRLARGAADPAFGFSALAHGVDATDHVPPGYRSQVLLRWGDDLLRYTNDFDPLTLDAAAQATRFGYNNDFIAYLPLPLGSDSSSHGLLCVNHESTSPRLMWPDLNRLVRGLGMSAARTAVEIAAIGHSVVEIRRETHGWQLVPGNYNRRITGDSPVRISGPAAGHRRLRTAEDAGAQQCRGILNPCSGGKTPWGTVLIGEENFNFMFSGRGGDAAERRNQRRYGIGSSASYSWWADHVARFDVTREPLEANRFGWVVELDPYTPDSAPVKRTALGRFKHEAATCALARDGRVVVYSGDDEAFEYLYRFVSDAAYSADDRAANRDLLDHGQLSVARFHDDGRLEWIALTFGHGALIPANGFHDQADVLIETRRAADLLGATRLDRPEDVETNPRDGLVYVVLTGNPGRHADALDAANPRAHNRYGHILRLRPPGAPGTRIEHGADEFQWETFVLAGDPAVPAQHAHYPGDTGASGWFANPDNCAFDPQGRIWIASDQGRNWRRTGFADGLWGCARRADAGYDFKRFYQAPVGAEVCGPEFTPDGRTLFLAVQHPGDDGIGASAYGNPATRWPDFDEKLPPRPSVVAISRDDDGLIGT